jgi:N-acetylglutamate synthase-like GNAT family acetyltransferase
MVDHAQESDAGEVAALYRTRHPDIDGVLHLQVQHESQMFVERDKTGRLIGLAMVSFMHYGLYAYGDIHELEVRTDAPVYSTGRALVEACVGWLVERGASVVFATATDPDEEAFYRSLDFEPGKDLLRILPIQPLVR